MQSNCRPEPSRCSADESDVRLSSDQPQRRLNKRAVDAGWPYQVALPAEALARDVVHDFCRGLSLCPRGRYFWRDDVGYNVFCFATKEHAEMFRDKFGSEWG